MVSNILLTDDGSEISDKAFEKDAEIAKAFNAHLTLIHVIDSIEVPASLILGNDRDLIMSAKSSIGRAMEAGWNKRVKEKIKLINSQKMISKSKCLTGSAADKILEFAENNNIDMIVMGSRRLEGVSKIKALEVLQERYQNLQIVRYYLFTNLFSNLYYQN